MLVGVWTWLIWPRFGVAIYNDDRAFRDGRPTGFLWVHALLIGASLMIGTVVGVLGIRAWRASGTAGKSSAVRAGAPQD